MLYASPPGVSRSLIGTRYQVDALVPALRNRIRADYRAFRRYGDSPRRARDFVIGHCRNIAREEA